MSAVQQITWSATRKAIEAKLSSSSSQLSSKQNTERLKEDEPRPPLKKRTKAMPSQPLNTEAEETISRPFKLLEAGAHLVVVNPNSCCCSTGYPVDCLIIYRATNPQNRLGTYVAVSWLNKMYNPDILPHGDLVFQKGILKWYTTPAID
ncbi:hypothetical protein PSTG_00272 [Puccinia striiformis f. sp. tritici PST-78]|uniref:Uncharacterized protein n=1 Tax=Puccinia striiformis f. sp. tritici PST-78 TaxID=1165861 RepID=A0A0L0W4F6_9BASI|nr:hypothetical protein PSTG_00272 [Puccinia striiformis f. sp. tritici PST-78]